MRDPRGGGVKFTALSICLTCFIGVHAPAYSCARLLPEGEAFDYAKQSEFRERFSDVIIYETWESSANQVGGSDDGGSYIEEGRVAVSGEESRYYQVSFAWNIGCHTLPSVGAQGVFFLRADGLDFDDYVRGTRDEDLEYELLGFKPLEEFE